MGKASEEWEFWQPFVLGAGALTALALVTVGALSHYNDEQRSYVTAIKTGQIEKPVGNVSDMDVVVDTARSQALATLESNR